MSRRISRPTDRLSQSLPLVVHAAAADPLGVGSSRGDRGRLSKVASNPRGFSIAETVDYVAPDFSSAALVTIDTQVDTLDGQPLEIPGTSAAVSKIAALAAAFRKAGRPIVHVVRLYRADGSNVDPCRRSAVEAGATFLTPGSPGSQLAPGIISHPAGFALDTNALLDGRPQEAGPGEVVMYKSRWGAFYKTPLEDLLRQSGASTVVFCGCNFPNCPRTSIYQASERDFRIVLAKDAISGLYERGCQERETIGVRVLSSAEVIESLPQRPAAART